MLPGFPVISRVTIQTPRGGQIQLRELPLEN
jgi:hypothetical protein